MQSMTLLSNRQLGVFPLTIGTSLSIEALANLTPDRDPVFPLGHTRIDHLMVNVRTMIRNIESAFNNQDVQRLLVDDIVSTVEADMEQVVKAVEEISSGRIRVEFYLCEYRKLSQFKNAHLVIPTTPGQKVRAEKTSAVIGKLLENSKKAGRRINTYDLFPTEDNVRGQRTAMLTHLPMDLVRWRQFNQLLLLESNTGRLKGPDEFHTKLHKKVDGVQMPLNLFTLQVFGDGKLFAPQISAIVEEVSQIAIKGNWTYMTTTDKIRFWLSRINLKGYLPALNAMLRD